jgi:hypothetical protein
MECALSRHACSQAFRGNHDDNLFVAAYSCARLSYPKQHRDNRRSAD